MLPLVLERFFKSRGLVDPTQIDLWLNPKFSTLRDPLTLKDMDKAIARLIDAFVRQEHVCVYADFDLDGTAGLALLVKGLQSLGYKSVTYYQPKRLSEGYGLHAKAVEELKALGVNLLVTVDVGITGIEAAQVAKDCGLDLIITDHHLPGEKLPPACAVVNPNRGDCTSGLGHLCGAGVAFYLLWALKRELKSQVSFKELLDCLAIATLTDMVPLKDENRVLVKQGLLELAQTKRVGLRLLLAELGLGGRPLSSQDVAIRFAPKLNALSRLDNGTLPVELFLVEDEAQAEALVRTVLESNDMRISLQADAEKLAFEMHKNWKNDKFVFLASPDFHRGVVGLVATKLSQATGTPAFVGSIDADGVVVGSVRNPGSISVVEALESASPFLNRFGGHVAAAGFETHQDRVSSLIEALTLYYENPKKGMVGGQAAVTYDCDADFVEVDAEMMSCLDKVGPFGTGFSPAVFRFQNAVVVKIKSLRGGHLKLSIRQHGTVREALLFSPSPSQAQGLEEGVVVDLIAEPQWNYFAGKKSVQILIRDIQIQSQKGLFHDV